MNTAIVIALIALAGSIASTLLSVFGAASLQARRQARQTLDAYRAPLLAACYELQARLYNILCLQFIEKYITGNISGKRISAIDSTLYVFAQFFGWREIIRQQVTYLQFPADAKTRKISQLLGEITETFISDAHGPQFMVWRVEQRGFGERMISTSDSRVACIGYAAFLQQSASMEMWLQPITNDIQNLQEGGRKRLTELQHLLLQLALELDDADTSYPSGVYPAALRRA